jgi:hypothetical protein
VAASAATSGRVGRGSAVAAATTAAAAPIATDVDDFTTEV